ncbi:MAG: nitroreductase [Rickettsiales bacterium]|nr:nitroreductase [Rickettsiales bacterium]|tara:strand:+ start:815 stop:1381 length:567 start_codon:yes stop_codon:yes gene_type:complete
MTPIEALLSRRSVKVKHLCEPAPDDKALQQILTAACRVPDHGKRVPWRILVADKAAQAQLGEQWAAVYQQANSDNKEVKQKHLDHERERPQRAPLLLTVIYSPQIGKIPLWEQQLTVGAVCQNVLHAAHALGYGGQWLSEWPCYDERVARQMGLSEDEKIAGFIYLGSVSEQPEDRARPDLDDVVTYL